MHVRRRQPRFPRRVRERGVVLLVALIFLILLTLLAVAASSSSLLQQRMVAATRSAQMARMSADTALRGAEWSLWATASAVGNHLACFAGSINATTGCVRYDPNSSLYDTNGDVTKFRTGNNVWYPDTGTDIGVVYKGTDGGTDYTTGHDKADIAANPRFIIEDMGLVRPPGSGPQHESGVTGISGSGGGGGAGQINIHIYRITARGTGGSTNTVRVAQSTFDSQPAN